MNYILASINTSSLTYALIILLELSLLNACSKSINSNGIDKNISGANQVTDVNTSTCPNDIICPHEGVGKLSLGDSENEALKKLGSERFWRFALGGGNADGRRGKCPEVEMNWGDVNPPDGKVRNGIRAYLSSDNIYMIKVESHSFSTPEGITSDSSPNLVKENYPNVKSYLLKNSASKIAGPRDLIYWVDQQKGIAFEFYYHKKDNKRRVGFIYVFNPATKFYPDGCRYSVDWIELNKYSLEE